MADVRFKEDPSARKAMRFLLLLQVAAMMIVIGLIVFDSYSLALLVSFLTLIVFIATIVWLYLRFQKIHHPASLRFITMNSGDRLSPGW